MSNEQERRELQGKIDLLLSKPHLSVTERKTVDAHLAKLADLRADEDRASRAAALVKELGVSAPVNEDEFRAAKHQAAFGRYLRTGDAEELRTYTPLSTSGAPIPQGFLAAYREALKSSSGIREAGATVVTTANGDPLKNPFTNDTSNTGERLNENDPSTLTNPTFSDVVFGAYRYASKGIQYSAQLQADSGLDVQAFLVSIFSKRIGRITNNEFTLGGSGAMTGVIPSITNVQTSASASAVTIAELVGLQDIDAGYLPGASYMFSPGTERVLKAMKTTDGLRVFPEMNDGMLLGFPYVRNVDMADIAASAKSIAFGNFKLGVTIRDVVPTLLISRERYAEMNKLYAVFMAPSDCQVVDANALAILQQAAS